VFDEVVFHRTLRDMIEADRLVPLRGFLWRGNTKLDAVRTTVTQGERDYDERALARVVNTPECNRIVVDATRHIALAEGRPTLVFTADVAHSDAVAACFRAAGINAASVHGLLPMRERTAIIDTFTHGELSVLVNCFDSETEILSQRGWLPDRDLVESNVVAAVDPDTAALRWEPLHHIIRRKRRLHERIVRIKNQTLDLRITEGHRMLVRTPGAKRWKVVEASAPRSTFEV
jgi:hypothetical protein